VKTFYVRPQREGGYGRGDGSSYENAWNGFEALDWEAMAAGGPAYLCICGTRREGGRFLTVRLDWIAKPRPAKRAA
jgi:hypothetical protein